MALVLADRVQETTTTTGTGSFSLAGAETGFRSFDFVLNTADTTYYTATNGTDFEVGIGTFTSPSTLARTTILTSSNSNNAVNWGVGDKNVFITYPAERAVFTDGNVVTSLTGAVIINKTSITANTVINTGESGFSVGPITVNNANLTISSGQQYVVF